jgi:mRNA export factor
MFNNNNNNNSNSNPNSDLQVSNPPTDTVSQIAYCNNSSFFAATSWDKKVRFYTLQQGQTQMKSEIVLDAPPLSCDFADDGKVYAAGCDNKGWIWDLQSNNKQQIAQHTEPIAYIRHIQDKNLILTGGWDSKISYWDGRQPNVVASLDIGGPFACGDVRGNLLVLTTAFSASRQQPKILIYDLNNPQNPFSSTVSPHPNYVCKTIKCFPDQKGYAMGTIEGRVQIWYLDSKMSGSNFAFKCHRQDNQVFSVNDIAFHSGYGTFATCGMDGNMIIWDKENRTRVKNFKKMNNPITCSTFSKDDKVFAYATGYDWSQGPQGYDQSKMAPQIFLHEVKDVDVKNKKKT